MLVKMAEISRFKPLEPLTNDSFSTANCRINLVENIYINFVVLVEMVEISSFKPLEPLTNDSFSTANCRIN